MLSVLIAVAFFSLFVGPYDNLSFGWAVLFLLIGMVYSLISIGLSILSMSSLSGIASLAVKFLINGGIGYFDFFLVPIAWTVFFFVYVFNFLCGWSLISLEINSWFGIPPEGILFTDATASGPEYFVAFLFIAFFIKNFICLGMLDK